jgi:hypothetical protein
MSSQDKTKLDGLSGGGTGGIDIRDEGATVRPASGFINFIGSGVSAGADGSVNIPGGGGGVTLPIAESDVTNLVSDLAGKAPVGHGHATATASAAGFMSAADKSKLDGLSSSASGDTPARIMTGGGVMPRGSVICVGTGAASVTLRTDVHIQNIENERTGTVTAVMPTGFSLRAGGSASVVAASRGVFQRVENSDGTLASQFKRVT